LTAERRAGVFAPSLSSSIIRAMQASTRSLKLHAPKSSGRALLLAVRLLLP